MRLGVAACAVLLALVARPGYGIASDKEYVYEYKGTVRVQNKEMPEQSSGIAFVAKVAGAVKGSDFAAKFLEYKMDTINSDSIDWEHHSFDYKDQPEMMTHLGKTFLDVGPDYLKMKFSKDDPIWSVNMKKALASMFVLSMDNEKREKYKVMENGPVGDVETYYTIRHKPHFTNPNAKVMNITKVRNYEEFKSHAHALYGTFKAQKCINCEALSTHPMSGTMEAEYNVRLPEDGNVENKVIEHICMESDLVHAPHRENGKVSRVFVKSTVDLIEERPIETAFDVSADLEEHHCKMMRFSEKEIDFKTDIDLKETNEFVKAWALTFDMEPTKQMLLKLMDHDHAEVNLDDKERNPSMTFMGIIQNVMTMDYATIDALYQNFIGSVDEAKKPAAQKLFVDLLSSTGTNPAILFAMDKFRAGEFSGDHMKHFFKHVFLTVLQPSKKLFDEFHAFCKDEKTKAQRGGTSSCLLAYTAMVAEACNLNTLHPKLGIEKCDDMKVEAFKMAIPEYEEMKKRPAAHQIVAMKMASNLGTPLAADFLLKFLNDPEQPNRHRNAAVWSLSDLAPYHKTWNKGVSAALFETYFDVDEPSDLRIACFIAIMKMSPPLVAFRAIVDNLKHEPSDQVISYVSSLMYAMAESKYPCTMEQALHARYVAPLLKFNKRAPPKGMPTLKSHVHITGGYDDKFDYGGYSYLSMIRNPNGYLPRTLSVGFGNYLAGFNFDTFGLHYEGWGVEKVLDIFRDPRKTGMKYGLNLWNYFGRKRRVRSAEEIKEIDSKIGLKQRQYESLYVRLSMNIFGHDLGLITLNESTLGGLMDSQKKVGTELKKELEKPQENRNFFVAKSMSYVMGSEAGIPIITTVFQPGMFWRKRNTPEFEMDKASGDVKLKIDSHIQYDSHMLEQFGIIVAGARMEFGVGFDKHVMINRPIKLTASANIKTGKLHLTRPVIPDLNLFHYEFSPYTFTMKMDELAPKTVPMYRDVELHKFNHRVLDDHLGFGLSVEGHRLPNEMIRKDIRAFWNDMNLRQKFYFFFINPKWHPRKITVKLATPEKDATTERNLELSYKRYKPEDAEKPGSLGANTFGAPEDPNMHVYVINADVTLKGSKERKMSAELRYAFDSDMMKHMVKMMYQRTPMGSDDTTGRSACFAANAIMGKQDYSKIKEEREKFYLDDFIDVNFELAHNADQKTCTGGTEIKGVGKYEHSEEQLALIKDAIENWNKTDVNGNRMKYNPYKYVMRKSKLIEEDAGKNNFFAWMFMIKSSQMNKFTMDIDMKNPNIHKLPWVPTLYMKMKKYLLPYMVKYDPETKAEEGKIHIERIVHEPCKGKWELDLTLKGPKYTAVYKGIPVPMVAHLAPKTAPILGYTNLVTYNKLHQRSVCAVTKNMVKTFDKTLYKLPETDCYKVIAKDCSTNNLFTVLAKKEGEDRHVKIYLDTQHVIEVKPDTTVVYNGEEKKQDSGIAVSAKTPDGHEIFRVYRDGKFSKFESFIYGLDVSIIEDSVFVQVANFYRGKVCGLCGDYNMDGQNEFRGAKDCLHHTAYSFARTFAVPDGTCKVPDERPPSVDGTPDCTFNPIKP